MRVAVALLLLAGLAFLPFLDFPEWRGTEARRVQIAAEMVASGDYIVPRLWGEETYAKPPFYYWVLAAGFHLFGINPWSARLPSVLAFWLLALLGFRFLDRWHGRTAAWLGAVGVLVSPLVMHDVPFAEIDPLFAVLTAGSMLCFADGMYGRRRLALLAAGVLGGLAVLTKGPPYLMFFVGPVVLWWRQDRCRGWLWYLPPVFLFYVVYKLVLDAVAPAADSGDVAVQETMGRLAFWRLDSLLGIPGHLAAAAVLVALPFSFWLPTWFRTRGQGRRADLLVWGAVSGALVLVLSTDRSTRYLLPAAPMAILGLAPVVAGAFRDPAAPALWVRRGAAGFGIVMGVGLLALPWLPHPYPGTTFLAVAVLAMAGLCAGSRARLARFVLAAPLVLGWAAFPDREAYARTARDFAPSRAAVLAREWQRRGVWRVETDGHVGTSILLHTREQMGERLQIVGDYYQRRPATGPYVVVVDRGAGDVRALPGYRDLLRVQLDRKKSLSLRARR